MSTAVPSTILIYATTASPRLLYVLDFIFGERLRMHWTLCTDPTQFQQHTGYKISYTPQAIAHEIHLPSSTLLFETQIRPLQKEELQSDPLAMVFFLLTRYEEYLAFESDKHGRFSIHSSTLFTPEDFWRPIVDEFIYKLRKSILSKYPEIFIHQSKFTVRPTMDIDQFYLYQNLPRWRFAAGMMKSALKFDTTTIRARWSGLTSKEKDPWDVYDYLLQKGRMGHRWRLFLLNATYAKFDKNIPLKHPKIQLVLQQLAKYHQIGIHPSYASNKYLAKIAKEKNLLSQIVQKKIEISRQHYIKLHLPQTYRNLLTQGILHDFSMGFADGIGFRAGTSHSFLWYDLPKEEVTALRIHPFCVMDVALKNYLQYTPDQASQKLDELVEVLKVYGGKFTFILHNQSFSGYAEWKNWKPVFERWVSSFTH
ncbi:MAG: polysaccharide deacetylase family protein [Weeksellaceae bacterium]|nr:polysaccharide deacetylase family protein [Weeksellaceae bacterium]